MLVPHNAALGIEVREVSKTGASAALPYREDLVGNVDTGVIHGGVITALLDATSGLAVFGALPKPMPIATLDLRIDYLRPADVGQAVIARATCYKLTRNVAFTRAVAYHTDESDPIAQAVDTFMVGTKPGKS